MSKYIKAEEYSKWDKNVSKKLTPLEALELLYEDMWGVPNEYQPHRMTTYDKCKDIIETALKECEELKRDVNVLGVKENDKKLKAFEIIKEKHLITFTFADDFVDFLTKNNLTEEEWNLLKELFWK